MPGALICLVSLLLLFADQVVEQCFSAADSTVTIAVGTNHLLGLAYFHHPHPSRTRLNNLKLKASVLHLLSLKSLPKCRTNLSGLRNGAQPQSLVSLDVRAKG
jgi:hypothetical protein